MAIQKVTMLFQLVTQDVSVVGAAARVAGWSESWYFEGDLTSALEATVNKGGLCSVRAQLLPASAAIVGQRYQQVDPAPVGNSITRSKVFPGLSTLPTDVPQMALLISVPGVGVKNVKHYEMRGVPDSMVTTGEFSPSGPYEKALKNFFNALGAWKFKGQDFSQPLHIIQNINTAGEITTVTQPAWGNPSVARLTRMKTSVGLSLPGETRNIIGIIKVPPGAQGLIIDWPTDQVVKSGFARKVVAIYPTVSINDVEVERVVVRKVGRPFDLYRGRR